MNVKQVIENKGYSKGLCGCGNLLLTFYACQTVVNGSYFWCMFLASFLFLTRKKKGPERPNKGLA